MAVYPNTRGFAYVVFEGPTAPIDWGVSDIREKPRNGICLRRLSNLLKLHAPEMLILRGGFKRLAARGRRLQSLVDAIEALARSSSIATVQFTREHIRQTFAHLESPTRHAIVAEIARLIPDMEAYLPVARKLWQREDRRMGLFDAAALAVTFYQTSTLSPGMSARGDTV